MEPSTLSTAESIVLDGANGVTRAPHEHFPSAGLSGGLFLIAALVTAVLLRRGPRWPLGALLALAAVPGLIHVLVLRADAPASRGAMADTISRTLGELRARAPWPQSRVVIAREDDDVLFPLTRYAVPGRLAPTGPAIELETRGSLLGQPCRTEGARVICGAGP